MRQKNIVINLLFFLFTISAHSQTDKKNLNIFESNNPVASVPNFNILYMGIENEVRIAIPNISSESIFIKSDTNGFITGNNGKYLITPKDMNFLRVYVYSISKMDTIYYGHYGFRIEKLPNPSVLVGGISESGKISKGILLESNGVISEFLNFYYDLKAEIISFEVKLKKNNKEIILKSNNNVFTPEMKEVFKTAQKNDSFIFQNIKAELPDHSIRTLSSIKITIK